MLLQQYSHYYIEMKSFQCEGCDKSFTEKIFDILKYYTVLKYHPDVG